MVLNAGAWGDTTADGLRRLDEALVDGTRVLIVALGANDGLDGVPLTEIEQNLDRIIQRAQARGVSVLLCGMETPPFRGLNYSLEFHQIFPRLAAARATALVPFMLAGVLLIPDMTTDGVHPNRAGAQRIAATIWPYLEPMVRGLEQIAYDSDSPNDEPTSAHMGPLPRVSRGQRSAQYRIVPSREHVRVRRVQPRVDRNGGRDSPAG
jgi:acyl-CoA thioesterase-1